MTDEELRTHFGLSSRALTRLRALRRFPKKDPLIGKTDRRAVDAFFDERSGLMEQIERPVLFGRDGPENFSDD